MTDHWIWLAPLVVAVASHLVGAIIFGAKIFARLSVLESIVVANRQLANGLAKEVHEMDEHGSRSVPLLNERLINEHVRIDTMAQKLAELNEIILAMKQELANKCD